MPRSAFSAALSLVLVLLAGCANPYSRFYTDKLGGRPIHEIAVLTAHEGDPQLYRGAGEVDALRADSDCLNVFRRRVTEAGLLDDAALDEIVEAARAEIDSAVSTAREAPPPGPDDLMTDVYASAY